jgi:hypothetical protein
LLQTAISKAPIIFVKLSEDQVGEYDLVSYSSHSVNYWFTLHQLLTPDFESVTGFDNMFLNQTYIEQQIKNEPLVAGTTPRWVTLSKAINPKTQKNSSVTILIIDSRKESEINLGRAWKKPPLGTNETYVSSSLLRLLGTQVGDMITLRFDPNQLLQTVIK